MFQSTADKPHHLNNVVDFCAQFFEESGLFIRRYEHNNVPSIVVSNKKTKHFNVLLNGHVDVVGANQSDFVPKISDGKLYGRGALDMKGPVAALMMAMKQHGQNYPDHSIGLMLTSDEEIGGPDGVGYLLEAEEYTADVVVVPDGGDIDRIVTAQKGVIRFKLTAKGESAHGSRPWLGKNAIAIMMGLNGDLVRAFPGPTAEEDWKPSINMGTISAGTAVNKVPALCTAGLDMRFTEEHEVEEWVGIITSICDARGVEVEIEIIGDMCFTDFNDPYLQLFKKANELILGREVRFGVEAGASDARYFSSRGMPVIISNPVGDNIHNGGEYIELESLYQYYEVLSKFLLDCHSVEN